MALDSRDALKAFKLAVEAGEVTGFKDSGITLAWRLLSALILLAPFQRLPDDFVLIRAGEMPQEPVGGLLVNERGKASAFRPSPGVQLDHMMAVINALLKRWRVPHFSNRRTIHPRAIKQKFTARGCSATVLNVHAKHIEAIAVSGFDFFKFRNATTKRTALKRRIRLSWFAHPPSSALPINFAIIRFVLALGFRLGQQCSNASRHSAAMRVPSRP
jgi:hypothetical protein